MKHSPHQPPKSDISKRFRYGKGLEERPWPPPGDFTYLGLIARNLVCGLFGGMARNQLVFGDYERALWRARKALDWACDPLSLVCSHVIFARAQQLGENWGAVAAHVTAAEHCLQASPEITDVREAVQARKDIAALKVAIESSATVAAEGIQAADQASPRVQPGESVRARVRRILSTIGIWGALIAVVMVVVDRCTGI